MYQKKNQNKRSEYYINSSLIAVNSYPDLPQAYSVLVLTRSFEGHPHLPSICIPDKAIRGKILDLLYLRNIGTA